MSEREKGSRSDFGGRTLECEPYVIAVDNEFQREVLQKLGMLEAKMDMLVGSTQPGRMRMAEERISALEKSDIRRSVYDRLVNAVITVVISAIITMHDHLGIR
jgi:hypothetical protein